MQCEGGKKARGWRRCGETIVAAALCLSTVSCGNGLDALATSVAPDEPPAVPPAILEGVVFEGYSGELRDLFVTAREAKVDMVGRVAELKDVKLSFSEGSRGKIEVAAPAGEFKLDQDDFELSGGVVGSAQAGEKFSTASVRYDAEKRELRSSAPVELRRSNLVLRADGMTLGLEQRRLKLIGAVEARVVPR